MDYVMDNRKKPSHKPSKERIESKDTSFDLNYLSMKDFKAFLILLSHSGEKLSVLVKKVNSELKFQNRNEGYKNIDRLCQLRYAYKRDVKENGKRVKRVYVSARIKKKYNKVFIPTIDNTKKMIKEVLKDYFNEIQDLDKIQEEFKAYTEIIINAVQELVLKTSPKNFKSKQFLELINNTIMGYYKTEMFKLQIW